MTSGMEKGCTCNKRTRITIMPKRWTVTSFDCETKKDAGNRPNGDAIFFYGDDRNSGSTSFLLKDFNRDVGVGGGKKTKMIGCRTTDVDKSDDDDDDGGGEGEDDNGFAPRGKGGDKRCCEELFAPKRRCSGSGEGRGVSGGSTEWDEELLLRHIKECKCTCNHMGYGNYTDWDESTGKVIPPVPPKCLSLPAGPRCYGTNSTIRRGSSLLCKKSPVEGEEQGGDPDTPSDKGSSPRSWCLACMLLVLLALTGVGVILPLTARLRHGSHSMDHVNAVRRMLREVPLIDGHNDLAWNLRKFVHNQLQRFNFSLDLKTVAPWSTSAWSQTDLPRLREGMVGAQFWSAYVPCDSQYKDAVQLTLEQINVIKRLVEIYSPEISFATSAEELEWAHQQGYVASLIGVEGGHSIGSSLGVLRAMYDLGARYLTLTHTCHTPWADSSSGASSEANTGGQGLTDFGRVVVREMNRLGMIIDLSHTATDTVMAVLNTSRSPVIFSHSSAQALCNTSRNVPDTTLRLLAQNGGLVMVSFYTDFLTCSPVARLDDVMRHVTHIRDVAGEDHVGIGAGYDGINRTPLGLEDVSRYPYLLAELARTRGWTMLQLEKLAGRNFLRVFRRVEKVKQDLRGLAVEAYEDWIPPSDLKDLNKYGCIGR